MPNDFFAPGLPTEYQGRTKATLPQNPKDRMQALREWEQAGASPTPASQYANEPSVDELLAQAHGTLDETRPNANNLRNAELSVSNPGDAAAGREQHRLEHDSSVPGAISDAATWPLVAGSFVPGPVGMAAQGGLALQGLYNAMDSDNSLAQRVGGIAAAIPFAGHMAGKGVRAIAESGLPSRVLGALDSSEVAGSQFASKGGQIPPVRHYWDALDLGETPAKAAKIGAGRDKASMSALQSLQDAGKQARSGPWEDLTGHVDDLADPLATSRARASERFGKTYRSETGNPGGPARSMPISDSEKGLQEARSTFEGAKDRQTNRKLMNSMDQLDDNDLRFLDSLDEPMGLRPDLDQVTAPIRKYAGAADEPVVTKDGIFDSSGRWLAPLAGGADDVAFAAMRNSRDPRR